MITTTPTSTACLDPVAAYHAIFPAIHSFPWNKENLKYSQLTKKRRHSIYTSICLEHLWIPLYLHQTHYASLVREQHQTMLKKRNDIDKNLLNDTTLREHSSSTRINWDPSDRLASLDLRLPSIMSSTDKSRYLEVDTNGLGVNYVGPGRSEDHSGTVRANLPIPIQCGVYYYEMHVKSKGDDGYIGIGFCSARNELKRLPGWDKLSFGYHGDDGHKFEGSGIGKKYGPQFQSGDVVGCGVDFANKYAFYTKNGAFLGVAFEQLDLSLPMFPCIGMRTQGEYVTINFGQDLFVYDIVQYIQEQKMNLWKDISSYSIPTSATLAIPPPSQSSATEKENMNTSEAAEYSNNTSPSMDQLILSYMIHHGYSESAAALKKNSVYLSEPNFTSHGTLVDENDDDLVQRLAVKRALLCGDIDQTIDLLNRHFPAIFKATNSNNNSSGRNDPILFQLKCQKFVEMIGDYDTNECQQLDSAIEKSSASEDDMITPSSSSSSSSNGIQTSNKRISPEKQQSMTDMDDMDSDDNIDKASAEYKQMQAIMAYGQELKNEFSQDSSLMMMEKLKQVFSLLAYPNPATSPMGHLLVRSNRESLASDVNVAILVHQNRPETSALDCVYRQLLVVNKELTYLGHGHSAFLDLSQE